MSLATLSALLLLAAGLIHSCSFMCRKLPAGLRPKLYPERLWLQRLIDLTWIIQCLAGLCLAFTLSTALGLTATVIYFVALPFAFQPSLAKLMGFKDLSDYLDRAEKGQ